MSPQRNRICLTILVLVSCLTMVSRADETPQSEKVAAPPFKGKILTMDVHSKSLAIVLDVSVSMHGALPGIKEALRNQTPRNPVLHVDGCAVERPDPRPKIANGMAPETVTAISTLAEHTTASTILWITDLGDPPNKNGIEKLEEVLREHQLQLLVLSMANKPSPSIRKVIEGTEGYWKIMGK